MTLGIAFKGTEGIVLAADSRVTITTVRDLGGGQKAQIPSTFDNAIKLLRVKGQDFIGAVTYDIGVIGLTEPRTAHSFIPEFETQLAGESVGRLSVVDFAQRLSNFFLAQWNSHGMPAAGQGGDMRFLVGGYNEGEVYGRVYSLAIPNAPAPVEQQPNGFGISWGGQSEFAARLLNGFDGSMLEALRVCPETSRLITEFSKHEAD